MLDYKSVLGILGIIIGFVGYIPYLRDTINGRTRPHLFSWLIWAILGVIASGIQLSNGAGIGAGTNILAAIMALVVLVLTFKKGNKDFPAVDWVLLAMSGIALVLWLVVHQDALAAILAVIADFLAFLPTFRKSFHLPHEETLFEYSTAGMKSLLALFALRAYTVPTYVSLIYLILANFTFVIFTLIRRKRVG